MQAARWRRVLGRTDPVMTPYESGLAAALAPEHVPEPEQLKPKFYRSTQNSTCSTALCTRSRALHLHLDGLLAKLATKAMPTQMIKTDRVTVEHSNSVDAVGGGLAVDKRRANITLKQNAAQDEPTSKAASAGRSTRPNGCGRPSRSFALWATIWGAICGSVPVCPSPAQAPTPEAKQLAQQA